MKEKTNLFINPQAKREARLAAGRRLISLSEFTELAWARIIEEEVPINGTHEPNAGPDSVRLAPARNDHSEQR